MRPVAGAGIVDGFRWYLQTQYRTKHNHQLAKVTVENYISQVKQWRAWCDDNDFDYRSASKDGLCVYMGELGGQRRTSTVKHRLIALRIFYDYAVTKGYCETNPARCLPTPKLSTRPTEEFTQQELRRMYDACQSHRERAIFLLLLSGGLRRSEVFGITKGAANFEQGTITVLGKGNQYRLIAPGPAAMHELARALEFDERLCPFRWDIYIEKLVKRLGKAASVQGRVHPHRFRHQFSTSFLDAGGSVEELQQILGHSRIDMSLHYARAGRKRRALEAQARIDIGSRMLGLTPPELEPV